MEYQELKQLVREHYPFPIAYARNDFHHGWAPDSKVRKKVTEGLIDEGNIKYKRVMLHVSVFLSRIILHIC
jgi:hypothetical protein